MARAMVGVAAAAVFTAGVVRAVEPAGIDRPARAAAPADRAPRTGPIFPLDMVPREAVPNPICALAKGFGDRRSVESGGHKGLDISGRQGQQVFAVESGVLTAVDRVDNSPAGINLALQAGDTQYRYYHLSDIAEGLAEGDPVVIGQVIGGVGDTGWASGGATKGGYHLHFEIRDGTGWNAVARDPLPVLEPLLPPNCPNYL